MIPHCLLFCAVTAFITVMRCGQNYRTRLKRVQYAGTKRTPRVQQWNENHFPEFDVIWRFVWCVSGFLWFVFLRLRLMCVHGCKKVQIPKVLHHIKPPKTFRVIIDGWSSYGGDEGFKKMAHHLLSYEKYVAAKAKVHWYRVVGGLFDEKPGKALDEWSPEPRASSPHTDARLMKFFSVHFLYLCVPWDVTF